jgi:hypothetical protein
MFEGESILLGSNGRNVNIIWVGNEIFGFRRLELSAERPG